MHFPLIRRSKIEEAITKAREDEKERAEARHDKEIKRLQDQYFDTINMQEQFHASKIKSMEREIADMEKKVMVADAMYYRAVAIDKNNNQVSTDLSVIAESMIHESAKIYTKMRDVVRQAKENHKLIEKGKKIKLNSEQIALIEKLTQMNITQIEDVKNE